MKAVTSYRHSKDGVPNIKYRASSIQYPGRIRHHSYAGVPGIQYPVSSIPAASKITATPALQAHTYSLLITYYALP
ncbi:MAG: hypothetical protein QF473_07530 [Planctomycetota bacterium]|nr:hypothetical protein [Planctomycetota bacterium]